MINSRASKVTPSQPGARDIFALGWPMTLKAMFLHGTVVIDGFLLSSLGEDALAAMGIAAALGGAILGVIFAFAHALQIRTAQAYGSGDPVFLKSAFFSGTAISLLFSIIGIILIFLWGDDAIALVAPSPEIAAQAKKYLFVFTIVIFGESIGQGIASFFNGCGRSKLPLYGYLLSVPINITASIGLIHGLWGLPALGVVGAAIGSAIAISAQTIFWTVLMARNYSYLRRVAGWRNGEMNPTIKRHLVFALPIAATFISATMATHLSSLIYAKMSLYGFAAMVLIAPWNLLAGQISMQWTQATGILVAQFLGQNTAEETLDRFISQAWRGAFIAAAIVAAIFVVMISSVNWIYPDLAPETRTILFGFLPILVIIQFPRASNAICGNTLRAAGDTVYVMHVFIWSQWAFRVPTTAIFVLVLDLPAFWVLSLFLFEELIKFPAFHLRLWSGDWKHASFAA